MTLAFTGSLSVFAVRTGTSPDVYTTIGEVVSITDLGAESSQIEATHLLSTAKEYVYDLPDGTVLTVTCNLIPTDTGQVAIAAAAAARTTKTFKYTLPSGGGSKFKIFDGLVLSDITGQVSPSGVQQQIFRIKVSGAISAWA